MRIKISERHKPIAKTLWLVALRHGCNKDLRNLLVTLYAKLAFEFESDVLRYYRVTQPVTERRMALYQRYVVSEIKALVDAWDDRQDRELPLNYNLRLQRVLLAKRYFLAARHYWMWLE